MSAAAAHAARRTRRACQLCRERKARFRYRRTVRADADHVLCFACFRSERDRRRARLLAETPPPGLPAGDDASARPRLTAGAIAHRRRMLAHLAAPAP